MLDVHSLHEPVRTWRGFLVHMATICLGILIAIVLEQSVEAMHRRQEAAVLRADLQAESRQILADATRTEIAHVYELGWLGTRAAQVQAALWEHKALGPPLPNHMPDWASPDIPIWRAAKATSRTSLLTKGEVNAYGEVEYVVAHLEISLEARSKAEDAVRSFHRDFTLANHERDFSKASAQDQRTYLGLLSNASVAFDRYLYWVRAVIGTEQAVIDGKTSLADIYASEENRIGSSESM